MTVVCYVMVYLMRSMAALCAGRHTASNKNGRTPPTWLFFFAN